MVIMADIGSISMVSYYNPLPIYRQQQQTAGQQPLAQQIQQHGQAQQAQQHAAATTTSPDGPPQYWYGNPHGYPQAAHHHQSSGPQQYLDHAEVLYGWPHHHGHHYSHLQYHQAYHQQQHQQSSQMSRVVTDWSGDEGNQAIGAGEPSPPITVSGSEISSPGTPTTPPSNNHNASRSSSNNSSITINNNTITVNNNNITNNPNVTPRPPQIRSPYEWMKKTSYQSQPHPACNVTANCNDTSGYAIHEIYSLDALGKTRTKDKYRVVYTDHQRLELEKEFHYNRYITMRRKAELATTLALSERQVKIWFQNRRAKQRKQAKKRDEMELNDPKSVEGVPNSEMAALNLDGIPHGAMAALTLGGMGGMSGMAGMHGGLMQNGGSPPHGIGHPAQTLTLTHGPFPVHASSHQHAAHSHTVLGL